jgi:glutamate synthase (NADPH) small chain
MPGALRKIVRAGHSQRSCYHSRKRVCSTVEKAFELGHIVARLPKKRTGKKVAVIGSGPAGLSAADLLNQRGHTVTVFEKDEAAGGLLRFGIPDFKLNKKVIDRRIDIFEQEGIAFRYNCHVGVDVTGEVICLKSLMPWC